MDKKKNTIVLKILVFLFIIFMGLYIANVSGYYETKIRKEVMITEEGIKEFEQKISNGEDIDVRNFLDNPKVNYSSKLSVVGDKLTVGLEGIVSGGARFIGDILKSLF